MTNIEKIRQEIEKQIHSIENCPFIEAEFGAETKREGKLIAYKQLLAVIDSLPEEKPSGDLEEAAEEYAPDFSNSITSKAAVDAVRNAFKAGATWRDSQISKLSFNLDEAANKFAVFYDQGTCDGIAQDCFKAGVLWMAKQHANDVAEAIESAFNAGKEWMAGQGFISEGIIYQTSGEDTKIELNEHIGYLEDCDEVIVNIRKKQ